MSRLEDLQPNAAVRGILPDALVTVVSVQWFGSEALELTYKNAAGKVANELLYRHDEPRLQVVEHGRPWSFDGDGHLFRLVSEAHRIRLAQINTSSSFRNSSVEKHDARAGVWSIAGPETIAAPANASTPGLKRLISGQHSAKPSSSVGASFQPMLSMNGPVPRASGSRSGFTRGPAASCFSPACMSPGIRK
jgi:hypothetical protein